MQRRRVLSVSRLRGGVLIREYRQSEDSGTNKTKMQRVEGKRAEQRIACGQRGERMHVCVHHAVQQQMAAGSDPRGDESNGPRERRE